MPNTLTWLTAGTAYPIQQTADDNIKSVIFVICANDGSDHQGKVRFEISGPAVTKGMTITSPSAIQKTGEIFFARATLTIPPTVADGDTFTLSATPTKSDGTVDGVSIALGPCTAWNFDGNSGKTVRSPQSFAKTPGDPTLVGYHYNVWVSVRKKNGGGPIEGVSVQYNLSPQSTSKLYLQDGTEAPSFLPGVYYINTNAQGEAAAILATTPGVNIQYITLDSTLTGLGTLAIGRFYFATTPDPQDQGIGWLAPTLPDAVGGVLTLPDVGNDYRITYIVNDPEAGGVTRHVIISDRVGFQVDATATSTFLRPDTDLDTTSNPNTFTAFSQDQAGNISCSPLQRYTIRGTPGLNLPNPALSPRVLPEALIDPDPANRILTRNVVNVHGGLGIALTPILIDQMGPSDKGNNYDTSLPASATTVVFSYYMNGYESATSLALRSNKYNNGYMVTPVPELTLTANKASLQWSQPYAVLLYACSVGWYQNPSAVPPRQKCGFEYYIEQLQNGVANRWYSSLASQTQLPYTANIPA
ncbi:hypothetical protein GCM10011491_44750 [Brucella endophytica]|uniref:Uncharacterized protein n=1 Tax=Brucella endophytica TaxID=1963359 RepID=A0A916WMG0_9HYPH|nr:hypothetical protein [Brucella endophytica]GGB11903.1 hypothetical protein GCM10011491_44750 [Brucella endophytica]